MQLALIALKTNDAKKKNHYLYDNWKKNINTRIYLYVFIPKWLKTYIITHRTNFKIFDMNLMFYFYSLYCFRYWLKWKFNLFKQNILFVQDDPIIITDIKHIFFLTNKRIEGVFLFYFPKTPPIRVIYYIRYDTAESTRINTLLRSYPTNIYIALVA